MNDLNMKKDTWDKLGIIATFIQVAVVGLFTALVTLYTSRLTNKLETYKAGMDESNMIKTLIKDLTGDSGTHVRTDFALLSLERYLRSSQQGELHNYDSNMLVGFAQSIIWERVTKEGIGSENQNEILIPNEFLKRYDSSRQQQILKDMDISQKRKNLPQTVNNDSLLKIPPVQQAVHNNTQMLTSLFSKTCYIQFANENLRNTALNVQQTLRTAKWYAPGIDKVEGNYTNTVKYFHQEDANLASALQNTLNLPDYALQYIKNFEAKVPKGQLEIWIGK
jgi:hypothetical protein